MFKEHKRKLILSSILIMLPTLVGFLMWNRLPDTMTSHWGLDGTADGYSTKLFAITVPFLLMLLGHWTCLFFTMKDKGNKDQNKKVTGMIFWILPIISIFAGGTIYGAAMGMEMNPGTFFIPFIGILFIFIGNYMPKCKQNSTIGIKIYWTLQNEENWNMTHRFGGKVWVAGGFIFLLSVFMPKGFAMFMMFAGILVLIVTPVVYSYRYYLKQKREGTWVASRVFYDEDSSKVTTRIATVIVVASIILVVVIGFTGNIDYKFGEEAFTIEASYWSDVTVKYENIKSVTYRDDVRAGSRESGFGSPRLGMGSFKNREFGYYTRYCYEKCDDCIVLEVGNKMLVINGKDEETTKEIYESLQEKLQ